ncbi:MAG TPA: hypothetical protein VD997_07415 [Phycisphaerales bacterium]|nr:hypothetical protein [Phycisphaerales bacterium]
MLVVVAFNLIRRDTTVSAVGSCASVLVGAVLLVFAFGWVVDRAMQKEQLEENVAQEASASKHLVIEIEAVRITPAQSIDCDADAIILHDGHGGGVYLNSHSLFEVELPRESEGAPARYPRFWTIVSTGPVGQILDMSATGELLEVDNSVPPCDVPSDQRIEVAVLDQRSPEAWRSVLPQCG